MSGPARAWRATDNARPVSGKGNGHEYRYVLHRERVALFAEGLVCWVMLNPSTADDEHDDATIRRVIGFSWRWGYARLVVVNLYGVRATDPAELRAMTLHEAVGPRNDEQVEAWTATADMVVCAWGAMVNDLRDGAARVRHVHRKYLDRRTVHCLGTSSSGEPLHPLYLAADLEPVEYRRNLA